jgi:hypothetical protein
MAILCSVRCGNLARTKYRIATPRVFWWGVCGSKSIGFLYPVRAKVLPAPRVTPHQSTPGFSFGRSDRVTRVSNRPCIGWHVKKDRQSSPTMLAVRPFCQGLRNLSGQSGGKDLFGNEWLPQGTLGLIQRSVWERAGYLSTLAGTMEKVFLNQKRKTVDNFEKIINIALGMMDSPKEATLLGEVARLLGKVEELQAKANDYDRIAGVARNRRHVLEEIAGLTNRTATEAQFTRHLQRLAQKACDDFTFAGDADR